MRTYTKPRPGYCASCELYISGRPVYRMETEYCCVGCAMGDPCSCTYEADMAEDGVDRLGLLFSPAPLQVTAPVSEPMRETVPARDVSRAAEVLVGATNQRVG